MDQHKSFTKFKRKSFASRYQARSARCRTEIGTIECDRRQICCLWKGNIGRHSRGLREDSCGNSKVAGRGKSITNGKYRVKGKSFTHFLFSIFKRNISNLGANTETEASINKCRKFTSRSKSSSSLGGTTKPLRSPTRGKSTTFAHVHCGCHCNRNSRPIVGQICSLNCWRSY